MARSYGVILARAGGGAPGDGFSSCLAASGAGSADNGGVREPQWGVSMDGLAAFFLVVLAIWLFAIWRAHEEHNKHRPRYPR